MKIVTNNVQQTESVGKRFFISYKQARVIALYGDLGSGKTAFVRGIMKNFNSKVRVSSPTFIIVRHYSIDNKDIKNIIHADCYRIDDKKDIFSLGFNEYLNDKNTLVLIEWPEIIEEFLPKDVIRIKISILSKNKRSIWIKK